jgi:Spy/CpxP family protein refolding chaperone
MLRKKTIIASILITLFGLSGAVAVAQEPQPSTITGVQRPQNRGVRGDRRLMRRQKHRGAARALRSLELSDQQKQQAREIRRANFESTKPQREELRQILLKQREGTLTEADRARVRELRQQMLASRRNTRTQMAALLTAEQKTKLEEMIRSRRDNRERFRRDRRPGRVFPDNTSPVKPTDQF